MFWSVAILFESPSDISDNTYYSIGDISDISDISQCCRSFPFFDDCLLARSGEAELLASCHDLRKQHLARQTLEVRFSAS